jgi:hypothetical protein
MSNGDQHLLAALATGAAALAVLLWLERERLLGQREYCTGWKWFGQASMAFLLYALIAGLLGFSAYSLHQFIQPPTSFTTPPPSAQASLLVQQDNHGQNAKNLGKGNSNAKKPRQGGSVKLAQANSDGKPENDKPADQLTLALSALGVFIALVTGITMVTARNAVEDMRSATSEIERKYKLIETLERQWLENALKDIKISTIADMSRASLIPLNNYNPVPLWEAKLRFVDEALRFQDSLFSAKEMTDSIEIIEMMLQNSAYQQDKSKFFAMDDIKTYEKVIEYFRHTNGQTSRQDYQQAAETLVRLTRALI